MVTGLVNGQVYLFSVAGVSADFESEHVVDHTGPVYLCKYEREQRERERERERERGREGGREEGRLL